MGSAGIPRGARNDNLEMVQGWCVLLSHLSRRSGGEGGAPALFLSQGHPRFSGVNGCGLVAAGDSHPKFFRKMIKEIFREVVAEVARPVQGSVLDDERRRRRDGDDEPDQGGEREATERAELKPESVRRAEMMDHGKGEDKDECGDRGQGDQRDVDGAMELLPRTAVGAGGEMGLVVSTHVGRDAGDVIAPAGEDIAHEWIDALTHINL